MKLILQKTLEILSRFNLPSPFSLAILLSIFTYFFALFFCLPANETYVSYGIQLMQYWESGLWENSLLVFMVQMALMLLLGHVLALTPLVEKIIFSSLQHLNTNAKAAAFICASSMLVGYFNWGMGLVFGAICVRKTAEYAVQKGIAINYPLLGACGYAALLVWHGGFSGSSLIKVAESGYLKSLVSSNQAHLLPERITLNETLFSGLNLFTASLLLCLLPTAMYFLGKKTTSHTQQLPQDLLQTKADENNTTDADKFDKSPILNGIFASIILGACVLKVWYLNEGFFGFFTPNNINFLLLGLALLLHGNLHNFLQAVDKAIKGVSGILIQFPLYFGIIGIMKGSGLVLLFSQLLIGISNSFFMPLAIFISAGIVNIFVPSGGGQWAIQGPILLQAAIETGVSLPKCILAFAYGDQLTNMLQPFWALPLLGITGLKAKEIFPYTLLMFAIGALLFSIGLILF